MKRRRHPAAVRPLTLWRSFCGPLRRPGIALDKDFAIRGHSRLGESDCVLKLQLYAHNLFHTIILKIGVFRSESRSRIDPKDIGDDGPVRLRVEINPSGLAYLDASDTPFGNEATKIHLR